MPKYVIKDIDLYQGDTYTESFRMEKYDQALGTFVPRDLTGLRMDMHVKSRVSQSAVPVITASTTTGEITLNNLMPEVADVAALPADNSEYAWYRVMDVGHIYVWHETDQQFVYWKDYDGPILSFVEIKIKNDQTRLPRGGQYVHDVQIIDGDDVDTWRIGNVLVDGEVTDVRPV